MTAKEVIRFQSQVNSLIFTACKRSLGQGNIFTPVCQLFCSQGGVPGQVPPRTRYTPWDQVHPPGPDTPPRTRYTPLGPGTSHGTRYTPREQCMLGDTGNKRAVRILLECILVFYEFYLVEFI